MRPLEFTIMIKPFSTGKGLSLRESAIDHSVFLSRGLIFSTLWVPMICCKPFIHPFVIWVRFTLDECWDTKKAFSEFYMCYTYITPVPSIGSYIPVPVPLILPVLHVSITPRPRSFAVNDWSTFCKFDKYAEFAEFPKSNRVITQGDTPIPPRLRAHQAPVIRNLPALHNPI